MILVKVKILSSGLGKVNIVIIKKPVGLGGIRCKDQQTLCLKAY